MKKIFLTILALILISNLLIAQKIIENKNSGKIGLTFSSFGDNDVVQKESLIGGPSYTGENFYTIGINYLKPLNKHFEFETGFEYSTYKFTIKNYMLDPMPGVAIPSETKSYSIITIPITLRLNFLKFFFINGGFLLDMDAGFSNPIDSQSGVGTNIGLGFKHDFNFGLSAYVNPYFRGHSLIYLSADNNHQRLLESGFRFGLLYQLDKLKGKK